MGPRRRSRWGRRVGLLLAWAAVAVLAVVIVRWRDRDDGEGTPASTTLAPQPSSTTAPPSVGWSMLFVADGDTFDATGPEGRVTVRVLGINAPEHGECGFTEARDELRRLLEPAPLTLIQDQSGRDSYGRLLRYVENVDAVDVGAAMVDAGRAISRRYWPDTARNDHYDALELAAKDAGRGGWAACDAPATDVDVTIEIHADAAGPDNENLNDEWVRLTNASATTLDLEGWVVADSTASNRYTLHGVVLEPGAAVTLYSGCGDDAPGVRYWCADGYPIWNNDGDTVFLRDPSGANVAVFDY